MEDSTMLTPGQIEEASSFYKEHGILIENGEFMLNDTGENLAKKLLNAFFYMKNTSVSLTPKQFVVGIEYVDGEKVKKGEEAINIAFWNPHKKDEADVIAKSVLIQLLTGLKS